MFFFQFLFIEGADIPPAGERPFKLKETLRTVSPTGALITTTKTTFANGGKKIPFYLEIHINSNL